MLNKIIKYALDNRIATLVITGIVLIAGCFVIVKSDVDIFPDLNAPTVVVMTEAGGLAPEEVERTVTMPIETAMNGASQVRRVRSSSSAGFSVVWVEFEWNADQDKARRIVSERLQTIESDLPPGVGTPTMGPESSILGEMMIIGLTTNDSTKMSMMQLRTFADKVLSPRLASLGGVAQISVMGGDVAEYQIMLNPERMKALDVTLEEIREAAENLNANASGGIIYDYGNEYLVKGSVHTESAAEIGKSVIRSDERGIVTFNDVSEIRLGPSAPRMGSASVKTSPAVLLTVTKQPAVSTIELTKRIDETLEDMRPTLPPGVVVSTDIFRQSEFIDRSISNLQVSLFEGAIFVIVVLFFFMMNLRTTLISLVALPLSIIVTVILLHCFGLSINTMSLGGIAIAIGSLVDDAIVDVENVNKRLRINRMLPDGERAPIRRVIFEASCEVRKPILNSTLIIAVSFLPLFFLSGMEGKMLVPLGISFIVSLLASTIVALTVTPVLCSFLLGDRRAYSKVDKEPWLARTVKMLYRKALPVVIRNRKKVMWTVGVLFAMALMCVPFLGRGFLPSFNEGSLTINISALPGISIEESDRIGKEAEKLILEQPEIVTVARKTGRAELDEHSLGTNVSEIEAPYRLKSRSRAEMVKQLRKELAVLPGVNIEIGQPISHRIDAMLSGTEAQIAVKVFGPDLNKLSSIASQIKHEMGEVSGVVDVKVEQVTGRPQIDLRPRRVAMAAYGITNQEFLNTVGTMVGGEQVSKVYSEGFPYDLVLKVNDESRGSIESLSNLQIGSNRGSIPLSTIADVVITDGPNAINRENVSRRIVISANVEEGDLQGVVDEIKLKIGDEVKLPEGYHVEYGGQFESAESASRTLSIATVGAILLIFLTLMREFKKAKQALVILVNMPLAMIGGLLILFITGSELNIPAVIGFISLMGIATRNGMLLMSRYNALAQAGLTVGERIMKGSADRLTPIIMTALTSALALVPLALRSSEPGNEIQAPMALVILGGLLTSTFLNIFVVPILYQYISSTIVDPKK